MFDGEDRDVAEAVASAIRSSIRIRARAEDGGLEIELLYDDPGTYSWADDEVLDSTFVPASDLAAIIEDVE